MSEPSATSEPSPLPPMDELYRLLIRNVQDYAIFMLDTKGCVVSWNEGAERITGYAEAEVIGRSIARFSPEEAAELARVGDEGRFETEGWRRRKNGSSMWCTVVITALSDARKRLIGYGMILRDLSDRKQIARQYEESRQRYRSLVEYNPNAVFAFDREGRLHTVNPAGVALSGYQADELLNRPFLSLIAPEERSTILHSFGRAAEGEPQWLETALQHRDLRRLELGVTLVPIWFEGEVLGVYALAEDVTERKSAETERERLLARERLARAEAEAANQAKSDFLAVMSHELRTPLNAISGYAQLLYDGDVGAVSPSQRRHLGKVQESAAHLLSLIEDILSYARMDDVQDLLATRVDISALVRTVGERIAPEARDLGLDFRVDAPPQPLPLFTDAAKVHQILLHLLSNALKFTLAGEVRLFVEAAADAVCIGVADSGVGIRPQDQERIWEPFWQAEDPNTRRAEGTGLGLSLARRLAERLGGDLSMQSTPEQGSTFVLRLPSGAPDAVFGAGILV